MMGVMPSCFDLTSEKLAIGIDIDVDVDLDMEINVTGVDFYGMTGCCC